VYDRQGQDYGVVKGGFETGANLIYEVQHQGKEYMIPDAPGVVLELDLEARRMVIDPVPGLIDDGEKKANASSKNHKG
jgi:16S rRNA processing protein RimM